MARYTTEEAAQRWLEAQFKGGSCPQCTLSVEDHDVVPDPFGNLAVCCDVITEPDTALRIVRTYAEVKKGTEGALPEKVFRDALWALDSAGLLKRKSPNMLFLCGTRLHASMGTQAALAKDVTWFAEQCEKIEANIKERAEKEEASSGEFRV